jgi:hypothetical protein
MAVIFQESRKMGTFIAHMKIQSVPKDDNRPDGYKVNFVLVDLRNLEPVLIVDNHKPFGYHLHPDASEDHNSRIELHVNTPYEALEIFLEKAKEFSDG